MLGSVIVTSPWWRLGWGISYPRIMLASSTQPFRRRTSSSSHTIFFKTIVYCMNYVLWIILSLSLLELKIPFLFQKPGLLQFTEVIDFAINIKKLLTYWKSKSRICLQHLFLPYGKNPEPSSRGSSKPRDQTLVSCGSCIASGFFTTEPPRKPLDPHCMYANIGCSNH